MNGTRMSSASMRPSVDLPAPRKPMSATRSSRPFPAGVAPSASATALRARASGGLVAAAQHLADARPFTAVQRLLAHELGDGGAECPREVPEQHDGGVALAGLQVGEMPLGHPGGFGEPFARHCAAMTDRTNAFA